MIVVVPTSFSIILDGKNYIVIDGISTLNSNAFFHIGYGASYNEIKKGTFSTSSGEYSLGIIENLATDGSEGPPSNDNWIHNNIFTRYGKIVACDDWGTVRISNGINDPSANNTFEDNVFSYGGHDCVDIGGRYNVIRNNVFHNDEAFFKDVSRNCKNSPASGYFGNRDIILTNYGDGPGTANHTLIEGNRIGHAGCPPDDWGSHGVENAGAHTIVRYNDIYNNGCSAYYGKPQGPYNSSVRSGSWARIYNNSIFHNGFGDPALLDIFRYGIEIWSSTNYDDWPQDVVIKNNIIYDNYREWKADSSNILPQITYENNYTGDPGFLFPDLNNKSSTTLPDLRLQRDSRCIDKGISLTVANGSGSNSKNLIVEDAYCFQDGTWGSSLSDMHADWIAIGTINNVVQIVTINYSTKAISLASPMTWAQGAPIWLFKNSRGNAVIHGVAPDIGAHEY